MTAEVRFFDTTHIVDALVTHEHVTTVLTVLLVTGVLLLVAALAQSRRTTAAPVAIYGPS